MYSVKQALDIRTDRYVSDIDREFHKEVWDTVYSPLNDMKKRILDNIQFAISEEKDFKI